MGEKHTPSRISYSTSLRVTRVSFFICCTVNQHEKDGKNKVETSFVRVFHPSTLNTVATFPLFFPNTRASPLSCGVSIARVLCLSCLPFPSCNPAIFPWAIFLSLLCLPIVTVDRKWQKTWVKRDVKIGKLRPLPAMSFLLQRWNVHFSRWSSRGILACSGMKTFLKHWEETTWRLSPPIFSLYYQEFLIFVMNCEICSANPAPRLCHVWSEKSTLTKFSVNCITALSAWQVTSSFGLRDHLRNESQIAEKS